MSTVQPPAGPQEARRRGLRSWADQIRTIESGRWPIGAPGTTKFRAEALRGVSEDSRVNRRVVPDFSQVVQANVLVLVLAHDRRIAMNVIWQRRIDEARLGQWRP